VFSTYRARARERSTWWWVWLYRTLCKIGVGRVGQGREIKEKDGEGGGVVLSWGPSKYRGPPLDHPWDTAKPGGFVG
jgi:hypothetical protein